MAETLNGSAISIIKEVKSNAYHFRRFRVSMMERGSKGVKGRPGTKPKYLILSENEIIGLRESIEQTEQRQKEGREYEKPQKTWSNREFNGEQVNGIWTVSNNEVPTVFVGKGKTFKAAKANWILQFNKTA
jgi:hypothetical protein